MQIWKQSLIPIGSQIRRQCRIIGSLMMREMSTRFGREGLGFAWLVVEPLVFCFGVLALWTAMKPEYEHGIRISAFMMTGYMCLLLLRHIVQYSSSALQANIGLMHHRAIKPLHIFASRILLEIAGTSFAFVIAYFSLYLAQQINLPSDLILVYAGWMLLAFLGQGFALTLAGLSMRFDLLERIVGLLMYVLVPVSGAFFMVSWLPPAVQEVVLLIPFPHAVELLRAGVFGEFVETHYDVGYALMWGGILNIAGLLLISISRDRIDVE
ncbi:MULTISPECIES: ABC transporter permease [unclassified Brevundimonas]|uniref:ABC transporter permease n=1 Tax=unclassified Brevundimonas TaxID=2622653 RepID=UPI0025BA232A|nr:MULTISPECIES: ABC transporter permease [unclassified Brevundimonas]